MRSKRNSFWDLLVIMFRDMTGEDSYSESSLESEQYYSSDPEAYFVRRASSFFWSSSSLKNSSLIFCSVLHMKALWPILPHFQQTMVFYFFLGCFFLEAGGFGLSFFLKGLKGLEGLLMFIWALFFWTLLRVIEGASILVMSNASQKVPIFFRDCALYNSYLD